MDSPTSWEVGLGRCQTIRPGLTTHCSGFGAKSCREAGSRPRGSCLSCRSRITAQGACRARRCAECRLPQLSRRRPPIANVAEQLEAERFAREEPEPLIERFVLNTRSGTYHRRVDASVSGAAACGWSFRSNPHAFVPDVRAGPRCKAQLCARCWPTLRAVASATGEVRLLAAPGSAVLPSS